MNAQTILERIRQKPFRPFAIETIGGTWIEVEDEASIMMGTRDPRLIVVFSKAGSLYILEPEQISAIEAR
jgi:hypothetical protein